MAVAVVVPWRASDPHREAAWQWVRQQYATHHPTWKVVTGSCPDGPWVKALAVEDALNHTDADTLLIADADVWVDQLDQAVTDLDRAEWVVPHGHVHRLDEPSTAAVLAGGPLEGSFTQQPYRGHPGGGVVIIRRATYERIPFDPRFQGWGQEDDSLALALTRLVGRHHRRNRPLWHLWHPPQPRVNRIVGCEANAELFHRYVTARTPEAMTALIEEARHGSPHRAQPQGSA